MTEQHAISVMMLGGDSTEVDYLAVCSCGLRLGDGKPDRRVIEALAKGHLAYHRAVEAMKEAGR